MVKKSQAWVFSNFLVSGPHGTSRIIVAEEPKTFCLDGLLIFTMLEVKKKKYVFISLFSK